MSEPTMAEVLDVFRAPDVPDVASVAPTSTQPTCPTCLRVLPKHSAAVRAATRLRVQKSRDKKRAEWVEGGAFGEQA